MIDLTDVILTEGKSVTLETELGLSELTYRFGSFAVKEATPVSLAVTNVGEQKLSLSVSASVTVWIPCARCLEPVASRLDIQFENELSVHDHDYIEGYLLNVDQLIHDEALLVWPERVLCREDCKGLCSICGQNLNQGACSCKPVAADPRMAKILDIFQQSGISES